MNAAMMFPELPIPQSAAQRKLAFLANRRSMAEMEQVLHRLLVVELTHLSDTECLQLESLLSHPDADLLDWMSGIKPRPPEVNAGSIAWLVKYSKNHTNLQEKS